MKRTVFLSLLVVTSFAVLYCVWESSDKLMVIEGFVYPDSTNPNVGGWVVSVYKHQPPPQEMPHLPPISTRIAETRCDDEGKYRITLSVSDLMFRGVSRIVVHAHSNPKEGHGWRVLEVKAGTFVVDLTASSAPPLPSFGRLLGNRCLADCDALICWKA
jgi:hypothetical protein